jgi:hypothetical protein
MITTSHITDKKLIQQFYQFYAAKNFLDCCATTPPPKKKQQTHTKHQID